MIHPFTSAQYDTQFKRHEIEKHVPRKPMTLQDIENQRNNTGDQITTLNSQSNAPQTNPHAPRPTLQIQDLWDNAKDAPAEAALDHIAPLNRPTPQSPAIKILFLPPKAFHIEPK
mmetsp:Transcript_9436/g.14189  ORF Transcript_9436/g.14189 Transcript_9436/m.14189 type:complete len:115 (-) Transcript_9436:821-1165(-)